MQTPQKEMSWWGLDGRNGGGTGRYKSMRRIVGRCGVCRDGAIFHERLRSAVYET